MAKLSADLRIRAQKELQSGVKASVVAAKFGISASACSYLKSQATGNNPGVEALEAEFSVYQLDRLKRLIVAGTSYKDVAEDYETSRATIISYCNKSNITVGGGVIKLPKARKIKITARGNGKRK